MTFNPPFNIADYFLDQRIRDGQGDRIAVLSEDGALSYRQVQRLANRFANLFASVGVQPEQRVVIALPDSAEFVGALFGTLKLGAVAVMLNPLLKKEAVDYFYRYTRASAVVVDSPTSATFVQSAQSVASLKNVLVLGDSYVDQQLATASAAFATFDSHPDDAAIWLFSGGTTGFPKAVVQTHRSFANTAVCYGRKVIDYRPSDITISVPKLYFGYATGSNLFFPFSVGAATVLFPERCTVDVLAEKIELFRPTILVNVPTMVNKLLDDPLVEQRDFSSMRLSTSAGEALPVSLYERWKQKTGVELLDGLGTAEMWHIFISNRPDDVTPGTLGRPVPGFDVRIRDDEGHDVPDGDVGWLWVRGQSRAQGYWQQLDKTCQTFRGEWVVTGDMICRNSDGTIRYCGRGDDMLKVSGKWLSPAELENCLLQHPAVSEVAVVGVLDARGLTQPHAFVIAKGAVDPELAKTLQQFVKSCLDPYKYPRQITFVEQFPRTHLGKVDRGKLREL